MNEYFELILVILTLSSGLIALFDGLFFKKKRKKAPKASMPFMLDYARSLFPVFLFVLVLRSFFVDLFVIPSGSMFPTLKIGDFVWVNKYNYGMRLPLTYKKIVSFGEPQRGDVIVFRYPVDTRLNFIKRVIGLPGDKITYQNKVVSVNGKKMEQAFLDNDAFVEGDGEITTVRRFREKLMDVSHDIFQREPMTAPTLTWVVPPHHYFVMGDNRDDSDDSRFWGFVPEANLVGRAFMVIFSVDPHHYWPRFHRFGTHI